MQVEKPAKKIATLKCSSCAKCYIMKLKERGLHTTAYSSNHERNTLEKT